MDDSLKLDDIVRYGKVDRSTARYVLQFPGILPGMPATGSSGKHRTFTIRQALNLAICAHLQMAGVPLREAAAALQWIQKQLVARGLGDQGLPPHDGKTSWILTIEDHDFLMLSGGARLRIPAGRKTYSISSETIETKHRPPVAVYRLDLTFLRQCLSVASLSTPTIDML